MTSIWKLNTDDEKKEMQLELAYQRSLTTQQRFEMMFRDQEGQPLGIEILFVSRHLALEGLGSSPSTF